MFDRAEHYDGGTQPQRPSTDNTGTLQYLGQGIYQYTFYRDIRNIQAQVNTICNPTCPVIPANTTSGTPAFTPLKGDLGDLTFDPNSLHRVTIQFSGNAPGTSTNTSTGADSGVTAVPLKNPVNVVYDFIPATGKAVAPTDAVAQRLIVDRLSCNECHGKLGGIPGTESAELSRRQPLSTRNTAWSATPTSANTGATIRRTARCPPTMRSRL